VSTAIDLPTSATYTGPDTTSSKLIAAMESQITEYNAQLAKLEAASGDKDKAIAAFIASTEDEEIAKLRAAVAQATERMRAKAATLVSTETLSDEAKAKLIEELKTLRKDVNDKRSAVEMINETLAIDKEGVSKALESIPALRHIPTGTSGATGPRVRAFVTVTGGNFTTPQKYDGLSKAAQALQGETSDLQKAYAQAAGVEVANITKVDTSLTFEYTPRAGGVTYQVHTQPKPKPVKVEAGK